MDRIKEMLDQLSELGEDQLAELQSAIISEFETVEKEDPTPQTVDAMTSLADMLDTVRGEVKRREIAAQELAQRASEASMRVKGDAGDSEDGDDAGEAEDMDEDEDEAPAPAPAPMDEEEPKKPMTEASTAADEVTELSTDATETAATETETVAEAAVETEPTAEAAVETEVVAEAAAEVVEGAEAASEETVVDDTPAEAELAASEESTDDTAAETPEASEAAAESPAEAELSTTEESITTQENPEAPVTAAAHEGDNLDIEVPADRRPTSRTTAAPVAITAGADIPGYTAGSPLNNMTDVAEAMSKRLHALRRVNGGDGEQHIVASVTTQFPEERILTSDPEENWSKIQNVVGPEALVAAGGHQAPFVNRYEIFGIGTTARPVRDALPRFQADRGGIRFVTPPILTDYADAVGVWTAANDAAESPDPATKASLTVTAASETTVATDAVTLQMQFGNLATRAYPELIARHNELGLIQHAREAEQYLLGKIGDNSTAVTTTSLIGFGRDFLVQVARAAVAYRSRHRLEADAPLRLIIPSWVKDAMAADLALSMPGDNLLNAYGEIDGYLSARGVVASYSLDQNVYGAQSVGALNEFADSFTWYLFAEGTFLFLDGGTLDLGIIRDSSLVGTNDYKMFVETFEGVAKVGVEGLKVTSTISVNGVAAALRDTTGGATAAAIEY